VRRPPGILDLGLRIFEGQATLSKVGFTLHAFSETVRIRLLVGLSNTVDPFAGQF
jgi:hypothetical protein